MRIGVAVLILLFGVLPIATTWLAGVIASAAGCRLHNGFANACVVGGYEVGEPLYRAGLAFWISVVSWPMLAPVVLVWLASESVVYVVRWWRA